MQIIQNAELMSVVSLLYELKPFQQRSIELPYSVCTHTHAATPLTCLRFTLNKNLQVFDSILSLQSFHFRNVFEHLIYLFFILNCNCITEWTGFCKSIEIARFIDFRFTKKKESGKNIFHPDCGQLEIRSFAIKEILKFL